MIIIWNNKNENKKRFYSFLLLLLILCPNRLRLLPAPDEDNHNWFEKEKNIAFSFYISQTTSTETLTVKKGMVVHICNVCVALGWNCYWSPPGVLFKFWQHCKTFFPGLLLFPTLQTSLDVASLRSQKEKSSSIIILVVLMMRMIMMTASLYCLILWSCPPLVVLATCATLKMIFPQRRNALSPLCSSISYSCLSKSEKKTFLDARIWFCCLETYTARFRHALWRK